MKPSETYADRDKNLLYLGFTTYQQYLDSALWKVIQSKVFARDSWKCQARGCKHKRGKVGLNAHHVSYLLPVLLGIDPGALVTLCCYCHKKVEFDRGGNKLSLQHSQQKTIKLFRKLNGQGYKSVVDFLRYRYKTKQDHVARFILTTLYKKQPTWYDRIITELSVRRINKAYYIYLRIN